MRYLKMALAGGIGGGLLAVVLLVVVGLLERLGSWIASWDIPQEYNTPLSVIVFFTILGVIAGVWVELHD